MFLLGGLSDRWGVRRALLFSIVLMFIGRSILSLGETLHLLPGIFGPLHVLTMVGMVFIIIGYGGFQPSLYSAVKQYTNEKTAAMGYALIYALQNLGAFASGLLSPQVRHLSERALPPNGITGVLWTYSGLTILCGIAVLLGSRQSRGENSGVAVAVARTLSAVRQDVAAENKKPLLWRIHAWLAEHPLSDPKFSFFICVVVPVQTLFAHAWLTLPLYIERAYRATPWVSRNFELFSNLNPLLIFFLTPLVAALTPRAHVYRMMIVGTAVMAAPTFLLVLGPHPLSLLAFSVLSSVGEALWQPRFLQYIAEIAPPGKTGLYMGVGQFPWFLTKVITGMYSGWFLKHYCPAEGPQNTEFMWLVYAIIACISPVGLVLARHWASKDLMDRVPQNDTEAAAGPAEKDALPAAEH
jgi:MFS family permease